jgi:hypothetical protein
MNDTIEVIKSLTAKETVPLLAAIATCATAVTSIVMLIRDLFRYRRENQFKMDEEYDSLAKEREVFWTALRQAYNDFHQEKPHAPDHLENLICSSGIPPNLLNADELRSWPTRNADNLKSDQRTMWAFASAVYPARNGRSGWVTQYSLIPQDKAQDFHLARNKLSKFWEKWLSRFSTRMVSCRNMSAREQLVILSWLEIALIQWTRDPGSGKRRLFKLAEMVNASARNESGG